MRKKNIIYIFISMILFSSCSRDNFYDVDAVIQSDEDMEIEENGDSDTYIYYKKSNNQVKKYELSGNKVVESEPDATEIEKYQLNDLMENRILVWQDTFSESELNEDYWGYEEGYVRNEQLQYYTTDGNNLELKDGVLKITAKNDKKYAGYDWTSASIETFDKKQFCMGRIEAKVKLSNLTGQWSGFWTLGAWIGAEDWPKCGEIDIFEQHGNSNYEFYSIRAATHYLNTDAWNATMPSTEAHASNNNLRDGKYHIFAMEWNQDEMRMYIDDDNFVTYPLNSGYYWQQFGTPSTKLNPFLLPHYLKLSMAVDPNTTPDATKPMTMEVDWVRVYASEEAEYVQQVIPKQLGIDFACNVGNAERLTLTDLSWSGAAEDVIYMGAIYFPTTVCERKCEFSIDNDEIASIDQKGRLTVHKSGNVLITAKDEITGLTATRRINLIVDNEKK